MNRSSPPVIRKTISLFLTFIIIAGTITTVSIYAQSNSLPFVTKSELESALANVVTDDELQVALNNTLTVIKNTSCEIDSQICEQNIFQPSNFTIVIEEDNNPSPISFPGSSTGTNIELEPGPYNVTEEGLDPIIPEICSTRGFDAGSDLEANLFICTNFSEECDGDITLGNPQTCIIENVLIEQNFLDLVTANYGSNTVSILLGDGTRANGTGSFSPANDFEAGVQSRAVAVGDFNNDGKLDLVTSNVLSSNVSILLGNGDGTFDLANHFPVGANPYSLAVGDFN